MRQITDHVITQLNKPTIVKITEHAEDLSPRKQVVQSNEHVKKLQYLILFTNDTFNQ